MAFKCYELRPGKPLNEIKPAGKTSIWSVNPKGIVKMWQKTYKEEILNIEHRISNVQYRRECRMQIQMQNARNANKEQGTWNFDRTNNERVMQTRLRRTTSGDARNPPSEALVGRGKEQGMSNI